MTNISDLTYDDFELLFESLDAIEKLAGSEFAMKGLFSAIMVNDQEKHKKIMKEEEQRMQVQANARKEKVALLRAKLIMARRQLDSAQADRVFKSAGEQ